MVNKMTLEDKLKKKTKLQLIKLAEKNKVSVYKNIQSTKSQLVSRLVYYHRKSSDKKYSKQVLSKKSLKALQKMCLKVHISIYKHLPCKKAVLIKRLMHKMSSKKKTSKFGQACYYSTPYFGGEVPSVGKYLSGTPNTTYSSSSWMWPSPGALALDTSGGSYLRY